MLSNSTWHTLSSAFLDEEFAVRSAAMEELSAFFKGVGIYGTENSRLPPKAPALRFVSLITLCSDSDREHDVANGSAANAGKVASSTRTAALHCIVNLRKMSEATYTQCCAIGREAEQKFETHLKMRIMPEYSVPLAFHLLSHRRETPSEGATTSEEASDAETADDDDDLSLIRKKEGQHRILRKRLKLLFDPLIQSLGDGADNISFLLRLTEILGKHYGPADMTNALTSGPSPGKRRSIDSTDSSVERPISKTNSKKCEQLTAKLRTICTVAREILLSYVKSDVNLSTYPGLIQLPGSLFKRSDVGTVRLSERSFEAKADANKRPRLEGIKTPIAARASAKKRRSTASPRRSVGELLVSTGSNTEKPDTRVTFSPVVEYRASATNKEHFRSPSPIAKSSSPSSLPGSIGRRSTRSSSQDADTLGTSPPSDLPTATAHEASSNEGSPSTVYSNSKDDADRLSSSNDEFNSQTSQSSLPSMKATTQSSDATLLSSSLNAPPSKRLSQSSSRSSNTSSSGLRKRTQAMIVSKPAPVASKKQTKTKRGTLPTQIKVKRVAPKNANSSRLDVDDLDFDFDDEDENKPVSRNQSKAKKSKKAASGRGSKSHAVAAAAKVALSKGTSNTARSRRH